VGPSTTHLGLWSGEQGRKEGRKKGRKRCLIVYGCYKKTNQNSDKLKVLCFAKLVRGFGGAFVLTFFTS